jgi:segregation and condensation protein B
MNLESKIEAILFYKGEPVSLKKLGEILNVSPEELILAVGNLKNSLSDRGIVLLEKEGEITLGTSPEYGEMLEQIKKEELNKDLSKASLETLSIILYKNGAPRSLIDYIRGVNSNFILRALSIRGLVEKVNDPKDNRRYIYKPTFELLSYMGVTSIEELPDYENVLKNLSEAEGGLNDLENENNENATGK